MVPSRTYIKEGLWNGDKCERPCQTVCGSRCFWTRSTFGHVCWDWDATLQTKRSSFFSVNYYKMFCVLFFFFFFPQDGRPENDITRPTISKGENKGFLWEMQKSFNFSQTNRFSLHEILIKTDCLRRGRAQWGICIPSHFQLVHYFISEIPPCGFCQPENTSDEGVLDSLILPLLPDRCWHLSETP